MTSPYSDITSAIRTVCSTIHIEFSGGGDGRLSSATKEEEYLQIFKTKMAAAYPAISVEIAPARFWFDVRVGGIPINLKLTTLGTDNCMNKKAVYYSLTGREDYPYASNWNDFWARILDGPRKDMRVQKTEYHYLVVNKSNGDFLLKSMLDIQNFRPNACNDLQIDWKKEFKVREVLSDDDEYDQACKDLLETIQTSVRMAHSTSANFLNADISSAW
jgi:hypothetical protein